VAFGACGPLEGAEDGDAGVVAGDDSVVESSEALSDPVPGLSVAAGDLWLSGTQQYAASCETSWKDSTHAVQSLCQIQRYWSSAWHADAVGWTERNQVNNHVISEANRWCASGADYTLRVVARGRVLWSTGWSPYKQAIGRTTRLICPD
jgi:hypothetical protein